MKIRINLQGAINAFGRFAQSNQKSSRKIGESGMGLLDQVIGGLTGTAGGPPLRTERRICSRAGARG